MTEQIQLDFSELKLGAYDVSFPTVGQLQDIEAFKVSFTLGKYSDYILNGTRSSQFILDVTDALAYFFVLIPDLKKQIVIKNDVRAINPILAKKVIAIYNKQFIPWFKPLIDELYSFEAEVEEDGDIDSSNQIKIESED